MEKDKQIKLLERIKSSLIIVDNDPFYEGPDHADWNMQQGVLITINQAKLFAELLEKHINEQQ